MPDYNIDDLFAGKIEQSFQSPYFGNVLSLQNIFNDSISPEVLASGNLIGNLIMQFGSQLRSGQTAYNTGTGFFLGVPAGTPKFSIGDSTGNRMTWDGTTLSIVGNINLGTGNFIEGGQTDFATDTGFFLGYSGGAYKFSIGDSTNYLTWDGTNLRIAGSLALNSIFTNINYTVANLPQPPTTVGYSSPAGNE